MERFDISTSEARHLRCRISGRSSNRLTSQIKVCQEANLFDEGDINRLGYEYLLEYKKPKIAKSIFKANTILHPNSANVFDSYAESLMMSGDLESSLKNYQIAVDLAIENEDRDTELFKKNLEIIKSKIESGK